MKIKESITRTIIINPKDKNLDIDHENKGINNQDDNDLSQK